MVVSNRRMPNTFEMFHCCRNNFMCDQQWSHNNEARLKLVCSALPCILAAGEHLSVDARYATCSTENDSANSVCDGLSRSGPKAGPLATAPDFTVGALYDYESRSSCSRRFISTSQGKLSYCYPLKRLRSLCGRRHRSICRDPLLSQ